MGGRGEDVCTNLVFRVSLLPGERERNGKGRTEDRLKRIDGLFSGRR